MQKASSLMYVNLNGGNAKRKGVWCVCALVRWWVMHKDFDASCHTMSPFKIHTHKDTPPAHIPLRMFIWIGLAVFPTASFSFFLSSHHFSTFVWLHLSAHAHVLPLPFYRWDGSSPGSGRLCQRQPATLPCFCQGWLCCERCVPRTMTPDFKSCLQSLFFFCKKQRQHLDLDDASF